MVTVADLPDCIKVWDWKLRDPSSAQLPGSYLLDPKGTTDYTVMVRINYTSPNRIHGLFSIPTKLPGLEERFLFFGYRCDECQQIFLVPESDTLQSVHDALRHKCEVH
jgi:hypothetical protein